MKTNFTKIFFTAFSLFMLFSFLNVNAQKKYENNSGVNTSVVSSDILIYPNPVKNNKFYVKSETVIKSVEVLNVLGENVKKIYNETNVAYNIFVELGDVQKGMYLVKITLKNGKSVIRKIILK